MQDLQTVLKTISETTENGKTVPYATPTTSCESGGKYPLLFLPYLKLGLGIIGLLHNDIDSRWDKFKFFALKILGSREWKIQMSTLDTNPDHNHHLFSYSVNMRLDTSAFKRGSYVLPSAATVNFLHYKYQCLQVTGSSTSLRTQGVGQGWWRSRDTRQCTPPQLLLFYLSHPMVYRLLSSLESSRTTFSGTIHSRSFT